MKAYGFLPIALAAAIAAGCSGSSRNETGSAGAVGTTGAADVSGGDKDFVKDAANVNLGEVELGRLATEKASDPEVRKFGQMMIADHTVSEEGLKALATESHIPVPANVD